MINDYSGNTTSSRTSPTAILGVQPTLKQSLPTKWDDIHNLLDDEKPFLRTLCYWPANDQSVAIAPGGIADVEDLGEHVQPYHSDIRTELSIHRFFSRRHTKTTVIRISMLRPQKMSYNRNHNLIRMQIMDD